MPRTMGHQRAFAMLVMGRTFSADDASDAGFVNTVVAPGHTEAEARKVAREICALPAEAVAISRKLLEAAAGRHDPPDRPGRPSVRRTDALQAKRSPLSRRSLRARRVERRASQNRCAGLAIVAS